MTPPLFWSNPPDAPGFAAMVLRPASALWAHVTARKLARGPRTRIGVPVICVGNINAGGTGKTPTVMALCMLAQELGLKLHIVSRGYGGALKGPLGVDETIHSASDVGDEPLLLSAFATTWIAQDRAAGAKAAVAAGAEMIVLDDGFQNPSLHHDLALVVVDAGAGFGNGRVMPAGPLREPVAVGLARADMVLRIGSKRQIDVLDATWPGLAEKPCLNAVVEPLATGMVWKNKPVIAFAGIGRPSKFFDTLTELGVNLIATHALADHARLPTALLQRLIREARSHGAQLVTTEKDATRLPHAFRAEVTTLPVRLKITDDSMLRQAIAKLVPPK